MQEVPEDRKFLGVPIPSALAYRWDSSEAHWWREGVRSTVYVHGRS